MTENGSQAAGTVLVIQMRPDGQVTVTGPLTNRGLCYAMLALARDAIQAYQPDAAPRILPASGPLRPPLSPR